MLDFVISLGVSKQYIGDVLVLLFFLVASLLLVFIAKRQNLGALIAAVYGAYAIQTKMFFVWMDEPETKFIFLLLASACLFFVFKKFFGEVTIGSSLISEWIKTIVVSFTIVGFISSIVMQWYSKSFLGEMFSNVSLDIFHSDEAQLAWMIAPILVIYLLNLRR